MGPRGLAELPSSVEGGRAREEEGWPPLLDCWASLSFMAGWVLLGRLGEEYVGGSVIRSFNSEVLRVWR